MNHFLNVIVKNLLLLLGTTFSFGDDDLSYLKNASQTLTRTCSIKEVDQCGLYVAANALDRNMSTCTRSELIGLSSPNKEVMWYVDLGEIYSVYSISIQFKDYGPSYVQRQRGRFAGFSLYLSNSSYKENGYLCYKDGPQLPPLNFTTTCIKHGRYIIYYNERLDSVRYPDEYQPTSFAQLCEDVNTNEPMVNDVTLIALRIVKKTDVILSKELVLDASLCGLE
ncbi:uncharacterized protein LOC134259424 [Saccostrea cucullata]|uniref:uncharacterized protein LOC134259424 n=1 Tax=Saccostrea cuccullata TaxID=36930 RepID=UPI002ED03E5E